jgi:hypothetical protein
MESEKQSLSRVEIRDGDLREGLWAVDLGGGRYRLENLPFLLTGYALGDTVRAHVDPTSDLPVVEAVVERSGHSLYQVICNRTGDVAATAKLFSQLEDLGCFHEQATDALFAIDVPPKVDRDRVVAVVNDGAALGHWIVQDAYVSARQSGDIPGR